MAFLSCVYYSYYKSLTRVVKPAINAFFLRKAVRLNTHLPHFLVKASKYLDRLDLAFNEHVF
jgi:hypothetical protein